MKRHPPLRLLRRLYYSHGRTPSPSLEPWPLHSPPYDRLAPPPTAQRQVALFWDLHNFKPPSDLPPYDAAVRLKLAAASFGTLRYTFAFANPRSLLPRRIHLPRPENVAHLCRVCGRKFRSDLKLLHHFKQVHEREQEKRARRLESARGPRRVRLAAAMSAKMHKYRTAARDLLGRPAVGCVVGDEIQRAGFVVRVVADKPEAALGREMVGLVDRRAVGCVVLVSDDLGFAGVVGMARERGVRTVVVGGDAGGDLRRCADSGFLWREVVSGKARKEAGVVVGRWKDREMLRRLEWTYRPERGEEVGDVSDEMDDTSSEMEVGGGQWWELDSDEDQSH